MPGVGWGEEAGSSLTGASGVGPSPMEKSSAPERVEGEGVVTTPRATKEEYKHPPQTLRDEKPLPEADEGEDAFDDPSDAKAEA